MKQEEKKRAPGSTRRGRKILLDRERRIRFTLGAVEEIQDRFDIDIIAGDPFSFNEIEDITWLTWVGLKHAGEKPDVDSWWDRLLITLGIRPEPELTVADVAEWIDMQNLVEVSRAINEAMGSEKVDAARLEAEGADGNPTPAVDAGERGEGSPSR